jgi:membrane-associated phospholipid phosphatase
MRLAAFVSRISHPFLVPVPTLVAALRLDGVGWGAAIGWSLVCITVGIVPPTLLLIVQRRRHGDRDWYVTVREQRFGLYALGLSCLAALIALARFGDAPRLLLPCLVAALAATAIGAALNRATKVSVHVGAATGCALLLAHLAPHAALPLVAAVALVAWSRLRLAHHTPSQVLLGGAVAATCMIASLAAFGV